MIWRANRDFTNFRQSVRAIHYAVYNIALLTTSKRSLTCVDVFENLDNLHDLLAYQSTVSLYRDMKTCYLIPSSSNLQFQTRHGMAAKRNYKEQSLSDLEHISELNNAIPYLLRAEKSAQWKGDSLRDFSLQVSSRRLPKRTWEDFKLGGLHSKIAGKRKVPPI